MWLCRAHNEVNKRNGKEEFYCDMGVLDARWKDCGCDKSSASSSHANASNGADAAADEKPRVAAGASTPKLPGRRRRGPRRLQRAAPS